MHVPLDEATTRSDRSIETVVRYESRLTRSRTRLCARVIEFGICEQRPVLLHEPVDRIHGGRGQRSSVVRAECRDCLRDRLACRPKDVAPDGVRILTANAEGL